MKFAGIILLVVMMFASGAQATANLLQDSKALTIEVLQVLDLPVSVHEAELVKVEKGYLLKLSLSNSSDLQMLGLRYSLVLIDLKNRALPLVNRTEGIALPAYEKKSLTFKTPIRFSAKYEPRLVLMLEQVVSRESIWEVVKAKEALDSYTKGDYSVIPTVLRVANQVDAPVAAPLILRKP